MPELTPSQKKKLLQLEQQADNVAEGRSAEAHPTETIPLAVMLGEGNTVEIGGKEYEVAAFPVPRLAKAGKLISQCPDLLVSAAMAAGESNELSTAGVAGMLNRLMKKVQPGAPEISADAMEYAFSTVAMTITEEEAAAMVPLTVLALSRRHPDVAEADIENDLDLQTFLIVLCRIFAQPGNRPLMARF